MTEWALFCRNWEKWPEPKRFWEAAESQILSGIYMNLLRVLRCFTFYLEVKQLKPVAVLLLSFFSVGGNRSNWLKMPWCQWCRRVDGHLTSTRIVANVHHFWALAPPGTGINTRGQSSALGSPSAGTSVLWFALGWFEDEFRQNLYAEFIALLYEFLELPALPIACVSQGPAVKDVVSKVWLLSHHLWHLEGPKETRALFESPKVL